MEQLHVVYSSSDQGKLTLLLQSGEGACQVLKKNLSQNEMARQIAENFPLSYGEPELRNDICCNCTKKCSRFRPYGDLTNQELEKLTDSVYHYQEGDNPLVEAIGEQISNEY